MLKQNRFMKKIYSTPEICIDLMEVESCILAGSPVLSNDNADNNLESLSRIEELYEEVLGE